MLSDPRLRTVYNRHGKRGLEADMAVIERTALPTELLEEYEKLKALWEERTYIQEVNPRGLFQMDVDASRVLAGKGGLSLMNVYSHQCVDAQMSKSLQGSIMGAVISNPQRLFGGLQVSLMHLTQQQNWVKLSMMAASRPNIGLQIHHRLSDEMYITNQNVVQLTPRGLDISVSAQVSRRLDEKTMAVFKVADNASTVGLDISRSISENLSLQGGVEIGQSSSNVKVSSKYRIRDDLSVACGVEVSTEGPSVFYSGHHKLGKLTEVGSKVHVSGHSGVSLRLRFSRANMKYGVRLHLSPVPSLQAVFYATCLPILGYACIKMLAFMPLINKQQQEELDEKRAEREKEMAEKRKEAEAAVELMKATVERNISYEQARHGLIIIEAWYGCLFATSGTFQQQLQPRVIDVTVPLQCLVSDSKLILRDTSKVLIPGFYDPCVGAKKHLRVRYSFRGTMHEVTVANEEPLVIPRESHRIAFDT